jgi:iron complex outermembrane receptor protein
LKKNSRLILLLSTTIICINLSAQNNTGIIKGTTLAPDGTPAYVSVELKKQKKIKVTDNKGDFQFSGVPETQDTLIITSVEFKTKTIGVTFLKDKVTDIGNIYLDAAIRQLQDIEVMGRLTKSYKSDYSFLGTKTQTPIIDIPQSISTVTKELIKDKMNFTLKDAADEVTGMNNYSGYDDYSIRGFKAENARMINGLRGYNTTYTSSMLANVERIEVIKGPAAVLYGNCDPGGTINLVTKKPLPQTEGELNIAAGTWNHYRAQGDVTGALNANKTLLYRLNAAYDNTNSFRTEYFAHSFEIAPSISYIPNKKIQVNVDFSVSHINSILDRGQPGFLNDSTLASTPISLIVSQPGDYLRETDYASNILFSYKINDHFSFNSGYLNYITQQNTAEHGVHSYITPDSVNLYFSKWNYHTVTNTFTNYLVYKFTTGKINYQLLGGYDFVVSTVDLDQKYFEDKNNFDEGSGIVGTFSLKNPTYLPPRFSSYEISDYESDVSSVDASMYHTQGIYIQELLEWNKWRLLLGLREELYRANNDDTVDSSEEDEPNVFLPRIGLTYKLRPGISLYGTYNKGFDPFEASTSTQLFDEPFKPVTSELLEAGVKADLFNNKLSSSISLYQLTLHNVAVNANDISNPNLYIQQGEDRSKGVEAELNGNISSNIDISVSYAHCIAKVIKSKIKAEEGMLLENASKDESDSWIKYTFRNGTFKGFGVAAGHRQVSKRNTLEPGISLPGYVILNAGLRYEYGHFSAAFNVNNVFNKTYWIGAYNNVSKWPGMPVNCMIQAAYNFK